MTADEKIAALIRPEYLDRIPSFVRRHAAERVCALISRKHPELYAAFSEGEEPDEAQLRRMRELVNEAFAERVNKHQILNRA